MTSQEKTNVELATSNTSLRKQVAESNCVEAKYKENVTSLKKELTIYVAAQTAAQAKMDTTLRQMKFVAIDATLHSRVELMEEFKVGKHVEWDP